MDRRDGPAGFEPLHRQAAEVAIESESEPLCQLGDSAMETTGVRRGNQLLRIRAAPVFQSAAE